MGVQTP